MAVYNEAWKQVCLSGDVCELQELMSVHLAVMLMETFGRLSRKEKYVWDVSDFLSNMSTFIFMTVSL